MSVVKPFCVALLATASLASAHAADTTGPMEGIESAPGLESGWLDKLDPRIPSPLAAHIVVNDHPMGSQIRLREGTPAMPTISLYIIAYNEAEKIREAIATALWADEVVLVDSNSTDGTRDIVREFGGELTAENRPEGGAEVTITLSLAAITLQDTDSEDHGH